MSVRVTLNRVTQFSGAVGLSQLNHLHQPTTLRTIYSATLLTIFIILIPVSVYNYQIEDELVGSVSNALWAIMNPLGCVLALSSNLHNRKNFQKFHQTIIQQSEYLEKIQNSSIKLSLKTYTLTMSLLFLLLMTINLDPWLHPINILSEELGMIYLFAIIFQSSGFLLTLRLLFIQIDQNLSKIFNNFPKMSRSYEKTSQLETNQILDLIFKYKKFYHNLFLICSELNNLLSTVSVWMLVHLSAMVVTSGYHMMLLVQISLAGNVNTFLEHWRVFMGTLRWFWIGVVALTFWIWPYTQVTKQSRSIKKTINTSIVTQTNPTILKELYRFSFLLQQEEISFSPYGLFEFSNCLIPKIISASITYLVLLIQIPKNL